MSSSVLAPSFFDQMTAYRTPKGKIDIPYAYVYDATSLTDGSSYQNVTLITDHDSDFILRSVKGLNTVLSNAGGNIGSFMLRRANSSRLMQAPVQVGLLLDGATQSGSMPILPEETYEPSSKISFDLYNVKRVVTANVPRSYIAFVGVRRFDEKAFYVYQTKYKYRELPYDYSFTLNLNWSYWIDAGRTVVANPRTFNVPVYEYDFELDNIGITQANGALATGVDFQLSLWDASRAQQFSSLPMNDGFVNFSPISATLGARQYGRSVFPAPAIAYPIKGLIQFDIVSLSDFGAAATQFVINFNGMRRIPV